MPRGKVTSSTAGFGIELVKNVKFVIPYGKVLNLKIELPTLLSRSNSNNRINHDIKMFLDVENGSIAISQAVCTTHHINIALSAKQKRFTKSFLDSLIGLQKAANVLSFVLLAIRYTK